MSGGHYEYKYYQLIELADMIEEEFKNDDVWKDIISRNGTSEECSKIRDEVISLISDLRSCSKRSKALEYYMSGDTDATSYLNNLVE